MLPVEDDLHRKNVASVKRFGEEFARGSIGDGSFTDDDDSDEDSSNDADHPTSRNARKIDTSDSDSDTDLEDVLKTSAIRQDPSIKLTTYKKPAGRRGVNEALHPGRSVCT
jgi:hypothetical protein